LKRYKKPTPRNRIYMREWRENRGLTMDQMEALIGLSKGSLSRIESGKTPYYQDVIEVYADTLGCTPADLISRSPTDPEGVFQVWDEIRDDRKAEAIEVLKVLRGNGRSPN
jgi:transcriptional regulator with XRE-family HTH domain